MTAYLVLDADGIAISSGTVLGDPLPVGLTVVDLDDAQWAGVQAGTIAWDPATRTLAAAPAAIDPRADLIAQVEQATTVAKLRAAVLAAIDAGAI